MFLVSSTSCSLSPSMQWFSLQLAVGCWAPGVMSERCYTCRKPSPCSELLGSWFLQWEMFFRGSRSESDKANSTFGARFGFGSQGRRCSPPQRERSDEEDNACASLFLKTASTPNFQQHPVVSLDICINLAYKEIYLVNSNFKSPQGLFMSPCSIFNFNRTVQDSCSQDIEKSDSWTIYGAETCPKRKGGNNVGYKLK